ncbi:superoxide dismutase, Fe-Mn family [Clostridium cavendishii DSM 21758]|uniref:Superoxide dismutase n=1 Tax=Clostridium cavendishii DSM 21758 TaxID=1121302 RepID=A0A1M6EQV4_9CLOT|nr:superoxide dismutase [Clostridium cavendishii]SHI87826.1 superoxide dismutase, Fe-Mn family [Clostridium cavendishii DSM 21758]
MKLKISNILLTCCLIGFLILSSNSKPVYSSDLEIKLKPLPYAYDALEPYIDKETMILHHDKHEQAYVDNLNKALKKHPELYKKGLDGMLKDLSSLPDDIKQSVINNGGGVYNHDFFWNIMAKGKSEMPTGNLSKAINKDFDSFENFKAQFKEAALNRFGSGWAWLVQDNGGKLSIISTANQDTPISKGLKPIIGIDVWEHAYYLKYQNKRGEYIDNWFKIINWDKAEENFNLK